jgi:hypothetical protein
MDYDVTDFLGNLFGDVMAPATTAPEPTPQPAMVDTTADPLIGTRFADWVRRPDCHGRMGLEAPNLPEAVRWWARFDFDGLPEVPVGFTIGQLPETTPWIAPGCVTGGTVDMLRPQGQSPLTRRPTGLWRGWYGV